MNFKYYKTKPTIVVIGVLWMLASGLLSLLWGYGWLQGIGPGAIVLGLLTWYDKSLWNLPYLRWFNTIPDLNGDYAGSIRFNRTGNNEEVTCNLSIKQTCSKIKVTTSFTKEHENPTQSTSFEAFISTDEIGDQTLYFYYHNPGSCMSGDTLDAHDGVNVLRINQNKERITLDGHYFTNRNPQTKGCMTVSKQNKKPTKT
jgi:hypothetical protein